MLSLTPPRDTSTLPTPVVRCAQTAVVPTVRRAETEGDVRPSACSIRFNGFSLKTHVSPASSCAILIALEGAPWRKTRKGHARHRTVGLREA
jgi:hypothetical protein